MLSRTPYRRKDFLELSMANVEADILRPRERTGHLLGLKEFIKAVERRLKRLLLPQKLGPKPSKT